MTGGIGNPEFVNKKGIPLSTSILPIYASKISEITGYPAVYILPDKELSTSYGNNGIVEATTKMYEVFLGELTKELRLGLSLVRESNLNYTQTHEDVLQISKRKEIDDNINELFGDNIKPNFKEYVLGETACVLSYSPVLKFGSQSEINFDIITEKIARILNKPFGCGYIPQTYCLKTKQKIPPYYKGEPTTKTSKDEIEELLRNSELSHLQAYSCILNNFSLDSLKEFLFRILEVCG